MDNQLQRHQHEPHPAAHGAVAALQIAVNGSAALDEATPLIPLSPPPVSQRTARSRTHTESDNLRMRRQQELGRRNSSPAQPTTVGCSRAARRLGKFVDDSLYAACLAGAGEARRRCVSHVIEGLRREILQAEEVRIDLQEYRTDLGNFFVVDFGENFEDARQTLCKLEYRVAALRDRLLYPLHYQQLIDLSHVCGCIHSVRMRLGFVAAGQQQAPVGSAARGEKLGVPTSEESVA